MGILRPVQIAYQDILDTSAVRYRLSLKRAPGARLQGQIELRGQALRFSPTIGADIEEEKLHRLRHREVVGHKDVSADTVQIAIDTIAALIHRESQRRGKVAGTG